MYLKLSFTASFLTKLYLFEEKQGALAYDDCSSGYNGIGNFLKLIRNRREEVMIEIGQSVRLAEFTLPAVPSQ